MIGHRTLRFVRSYVHHRALGNGLKAVRSIATNPDRLVQCVSLEHLAHQGQVRLQITDATTAAIRIVPTLQQAEFALRVFAPTAQTNVHQVDVFTVAKAPSAYDNTHVKALELSSVSANGLDAMDVVLNIPHLVDLDINVMRGAIKIEEKIEGNVRISVSEGDITVNKVRGEQIQLKTNRGRVTVSSLVEGENVKMVASAISVKRLMSTSAEIRIAKGTEDSDLGAIYSPLCLVHSQSTGALNVGNIHGFLRVNGDDMKAVTLHSVNGALDIEDSGSNCSVDAHFDAWSPDGGNKIFVGGDVRVSLDPSAPINLELHGNKIATGNCEFEEQELDQLDEDYAIFAGSLIANSTTSSATGASGKVNVGGAKTSALRTSFFATDKDESDHGSQSASSDIHPARLPRLVVHASNGSVSVEQLDWMGKIKRKHLRQ